MIAHLASLFRLRLALLNGSAALAGALLLAAPLPAAVAAGTLLGVALLAAGGSALNQAIEHKRDNLMQRTRLRPVACGAMSPASAALVGSLILATGLILLALIGPPDAALSGGVGLLVYLGIYTPLKPRTPYALLAGALSGALPPLIGWRCAGGDYGDYRIILLAGLLYLWQIPHFWMFQRRHAADYRAAGFPLLNAVVRDNSLSPLLALWLAALAAATLLLPALLPISRWAAISLALLPLPLLALTLLYRERALYSYLNLFPLLLTLAIAAGGVFL